MEKDLILLIASLVRRVREEQHLTQEELSLRAELDRTYISGIERGIRNISLKSLAKILQALDLDILTFADELSKEFTLFSAKHTQTKLDS